MTNEDRLRESVEHVELVHEREIAPGLDHVAIAILHVEMHRLHDCNHTHDRKGRIHWKG